MHFTNSNFNSPGMNVQNSVVTVYTYDKPLPNQIIINNASFVIQQQYYGKIFKYTPANSESLVNNGIVFLRINSLPLDELPKRICVNKRHFLQRMGGFYTPESNFLHEEISFYFDSIAEEYENIITPPLNKQVIFYLLSKTEKTFPKGKELKILDYGIGTGLSSEVVSLQRYNGRIELYGVDISGKMVEICKRKGMKNVKQNTYYDIEFPSNYFDGVLSTFVVHYFIDPLPFQLMANVLKMNGILAFNLHRLENGYYEYYSKILDKLGFFVLTKKAQKPIAIKVEKNVNSLPFIVAKKVRKVEYPAFQPPLRL